MALCVSGPAYAQICTGIGQCEVTIDGVNSTLDTDVKIGWHDGIKTEKTQVSVLDYKQLQNSKFSMNLASGNQSQIVLLSDDCDNLFPATATVEIYGEIIYQNQVFTKADGEPMVLQSTESLEQWPPSSTVCYKVQENAIFTNGGHTIVINAGSTVCMD
jgi:hypothetical protein